MCACLIDTEFPMWVLVFERLGPGSAILVFSGAVLWKLVPPASRLLASWRKQSDTITAAVPAVLDGVKDLVRHVERVADHVAGISPGGGWSDSLRMRRADPPVCDSSATAEDS